MENKLILYAGGFILPDKNAAAHRVISNAKLLRKIGFKVVLISVSKENFVNETEVKYVQGFRYYEKKYPERNIDWFKYLSSVEDVLRIYEKEGKDGIHSIILYNYPSIAFYRILKIFKDKGVKIISDCTEWYGSSKGSVFHRTLKKLDNIFRIKFLNKKADGLICVSKFLFNFYSAVPNKTIIPPLVDLNEDKWPKNVSELTEKKTFTYVGSPGSTNEKESFIELITIFAKLSKNYNFSFNIVGISKEEIVRNFPSISKLIENLKCINFLGKQDNKTCIEIINRSHFFIFIRYNSIVTKAGFPTKFVESISAGTPVITNKSSDLSGYLIEFKNGIWLNEKNPDEMYKTIENCLNLANNKIMEMKNYCLNTGAFDYSNFMPSMKKLFNVENEKDSYTA